MSFEHAVLDPFSAKAEGARCPDYYSFPTETKTFKFKFTMKTCDSTAATIASSGATNIDWVECIFKPSLIESVVYPKSQAGLSDMNIGALVQTGTGLFGTNTTSGTSRDSGATYAQRTNAVDCNKYQLHSSGFIDESFGTQFSKYRMVGGGVRMSSLIVPEKSTGYISLYSGPCSAVDYSNQEFQSLDAAAAANADLVRTNTGRPVDSDTVNPTHSMKLRSDMSEEPTGAVLDHYQFNGKGLEYAFRPTSEHAFDWRETNSTRSYSGFTPYIPGTNTSSAAITVQEGDILTNVSGSSAYYGKSAYYDTEGWSFLCMRGCDLPSATGAQFPIMVVELVYHVEYISSQIGLTSSAKFSPISAGMLENVLYKAAKLPMYRQLYSGASSGAKMKSRMGF